MDFSFLIWNVRGLNDPARRSVVRSVVVRHNVAVVCLQESKLAFVDAEIVSQCCGSLFTGFASVPAVGTRGGIIVAWREDLVTFSNFQRKQSFIAAEGHLSQNDASFNLVIVYGPQGDDEKLSFLLDLKNLYEQQLTADIVIASAQDKNNARINRRCLSAFRSFINELQLKDLYLHGRRYTWSNEQRQATMVKLDRVLFNEEWDTLFPGCMLQALSSEMSEMSDHCRLLLTCDAGFSHSRRFRFENHWANHVEFSPTVASAWNSTPRHLDPLANIAARLRATAGALKKWSSQLHGDLALRAAVTSTLILLLDKAMEKRQLTEQELRFRAMLKVNSLGIAAIQRSIWRQRSRIQWLKEGEASTRFFHSKASARRRRNFVQNLVVDDVVITDQEGKEQAFFNHFAELLGSCHPRPCTLNLDAVAVPTFELSDLDAPFTPAEIKTAVFELNPAKAPGPDGFTARFLQSSWSIISSDFIAGISAVHDLKTAYLHQLNTATLILLPKTPDAESAKQFRPISLIGIFAKLLMKLHASRLRPKMQRMVRPCQNAFIAGRAIQDSFIYVRGLAKSFRQSKTPALMVKIDIEKAFDSVSWEFLLELLAKLGFGRRWRDRLAAILRTSSTRILVNGVLSDLLQHRRGLRQGDPLSPLLFDMVMDCFAGLFSAAVEAGFLKPIGNRAMPFRTALYADDAVLFINPVACEITLVHQLLQLFGDATGLRTNFSKSSFTPICCETSALQVFWRASVVKPNPSPAPTSACRFRTPACGEWTCSLFLTRSAPS
ncbi:unnamed protein product [Alopecurus aequalis]